MSATETAGLRLEPVAADLSFPTSLAFDDDGVVHVAESGLPFGGAAPGGRIWRLGARGERTLVAEGLRPPVNGLAFHDGGLYVSEGGHPARIRRLDRDGAWTAVLEGLPGPGNYHTNMVAFGPDGRLYFSQGAMTNTGIVGLDAYEVGWLRQLPHAHDLPGLDITLAGVNVRTPNPLADAGGEAITGAFVPFGTATRAGHRLAGCLPATAAIMRCDPDGSGLELVAWGLRNAYGLGFLPDGRLLAVDQGADDRGSRPVGEVPDLLYEIVMGGWYGWPDYIGGHPITDPAYRPKRGPAPTFVLANHDELPPPERPLLRFPPHVAAVKFAVAPPGSGHAGDLYVALFGDEAPMTAPSGPRVGRSLVRVETSNWALHPFIDGLQRPIDVGVDPAGEWLYVLDFGEFEMDDQGVQAKAGTGRLWRVALGAEGTCA